MHFNIKTITHVEFSIENSKSNLHGSISTNLLEIANRFCRAISVENARINLRREVGDKLEQFKYDFSMVFFYISPKYILLKKIELKCRKFQEYSRNYYDKP